MRTIAIASVKGGTGKTTTTINIAAALAQLGRKILVIDNDSQGCATKAAGLTPNELRYTLSALMSRALEYPEELPELLPRVIVDRSEIAPSGTVHLIPANAKLTATQTSLSALQTANMVSEIDQEGTGYAGVMGRILDALEDRYDYVLIDCSNNRDILLVNALTCADEVIIPVQAQYLAYEGLPDTLDVVAHVQKSSNPRLRIGGVLLTCYQAQTNLSKAIRQNIQETYGAEAAVFEDPIPYSIRVAEHPAYGMSLLNYEATNPAAVAYQSVAEEVLRHAET